MSILNLLHSVAFNFKLLLEFVVLCGMGFSIIIPSSSKAFAESFSEGKQFLAIGIMIIGLALGELQVQVFALVKFDDGIANDNSIYWIIDTHKNLIFQLPLC